MNNKILAGLLHLFISTPIWYFLLYSILSSIHPDRLVWFLFWIYVPVGLINASISISGEKK